MKKLLPLIFVFALIFPQVTHAEWWNPTTWFSKSEIRQEAPIDVPKVEVTEPAINIPSTGPTTTPKVISIEKIITKIVERPVIVEKTITIQDPTFLSQIESLKIQINTLKSQLASKSCPAANSVPESVTQTNPTPVQNTPVVQDVQQPVHHVTVTGFKIKDVPCVHYDEAIAAGSTFGGAAANFGDIELSGDSIPVNLKDSGSINITVNSPQNLNQVKLTPADVQTEYPFFAEGKGQKTLTIVGTGYSAIPFKKQPISIGASWTDQALPVSLDITINYIKFSDGTEAGGLPITVKGLQVSKCVWNN